ncbi:recombinase family protein [Conexibacter stalactiti]|uniref:Recombinase family protein n=1 Tax=Conexibacter stalactiti TaxID=1940611 RepID=A0ABU4HTA7_9ACTN|nr:recombinase family protein [Conexibacter stalactiti]MDW5595294.1 recombinase family protein [Conexibacter stalactiti]MEC5035936.1 recombinase family protein [Conexibacter stalactiti]
MIASARKPAEDHGAGSSLDDQREAITTFAAENGLGLVEVPKALRAVAYVRESTEEQGEGFSPGAQREAIKRFAAENGLDLVEEYVDFHSGWRKTDGRRDFHRLMADAAEKRFDVVLVFHTSRFARNQVEARKYKQLLRDKLGIKVFSVTQPMGDDHSDPSSFLAESIHEMFDEYYSVSLSFWTRSGLREKARQGYLTGSLPWGYVRDGESGDVVLDPDRAPLVLGIFERYSTGDESDRTIAEWLNAKGATTARGRRFQADTVREMLVNASYCGYVTGLRDQSREIRGRHEPIVPEELFDRVQQIRSWRSRVVGSTGRPSEDYLLRKLLYCERCNGRMQGTRGSRAQLRRYQCGTRRRGGGCDQAIVKAEPLEGQLVEWLRDFRPDSDLRQLVIDAIQAEARARAGDQPDRRRELLAQLERLQDLYVMGDLTRGQYTMRRQALEQEVERIGPPVDPDLDRAEKLLDEFAGFWEVEQQPAERRRLLGQLFDRIWQDDGVIVADRPRAVLRHCRGHPGDQRNA